MHLAWPPVVVWLDGPLIAKFAGAVFHTTRLRCMFVGIGNKTLDGLQAADGWWRTVDFPVKLACELTWDFRVASGEQGDCMCCAAPSLHGLRDRLAKRAGSVLCRSCSMYEVAAWDRGSVPAVRSRIM